MEILNNKDEETAQMGYIKQQKFVGRIKPYKGHSIFQYDTKTGEIKEAEVEVSIDINSKKTKKLVINNRYIYKSFLNLKNATEKFPKIIRNDR